MRRETAFKVMSAAALACIAAWTAMIAGWIPAFAAMAVFIVAFPVFVIFLALWWMYSQGKEDIPFIGY